MDAVTSGSQTLPEEQQTGRLAQQDGVLWQTSNTTSDRPRRVAHMPNNIFLLEGIKKVWVGVLETVSGSEEVGSRDGIFHYLNIKGI